MKRANANKQPIAMHHVHHLQLASTLKAWDLVIVWDQGFLLGGQVVDQGRWLYERQISSINCGNLNRSD